MGQRSGRLPPRRPHLPTSPVRLPSVPCRLRRNPVRKASLCRSLRHDRAVDLRRHAARGKCMARRSRRGSLITLLLQYLAIS